MKIAYVTTYYVSDLHEASGSGWYIYNFLKTSGFEVVSTGRLKNKWFRLLNFKKSLYEKALNKNYLAERDPLLLRPYARQVEKALRGIDPDIILSPGTVPVAYLNTEKPVVFWSDATFAGLVDYYPRFSGLCRETIRAGHRMEQQALARCRLAVYNSEWAAKTATDNYDVDPGKVKVVPYGANIEHNNTREDILGRLKKKDFSVCKLLFVGVDWLRKGGDIAFEAAKILNREGIRTKLDIVGCAPLSLPPDFVTQHGFISKKEQRGLRRLNELFTQAHFLILPSGADCAPVVIAEAGSYGLPALTTDTGGISTAVTNGKNGQMFALSDGPEKYSEYLKKMISSKDEYRALAMSSFEEYEQRLNWPLSVEKLGNLIKEFCR